MLLIMAPAKATMLVVVGVCGSGSLMDCVFDLNHTINHTFANYFHHKCILLGKSKPNAHIERAR